MLIIYGLGNNEEKYFNTKHNIGRVVVEGVVKQMGLCFSKQLETHYAKTKIEGEDVYFVYSNEYMNTSGLSLKTLTRYSSLQKAKIFVIQDDSDQLEGNSKLVIGGGNAGHNGIKDIHNHFKLEKNNLIRLKIGIRPLQNSQPSISFVLKKMSKIDQSNADFLIKVLRDNISQLLTDEFSDLQKIINTKRSY